ncbi:AAA family ATPase [Tateyamaria sp. ANG-S1]|uniref:ExeA family protein n=1 Tax=Tateyamaria sp. ANG-S1 TaxID=1577905 RepID=UPI00057C7096|nr:AAA family ATPase [Tateyamaria sp. ANG-S1]KIC45466.1 ATPase [Tateyamaria sp. ANG-S1]
MNTLDIYTRHFGMRERPFSLVPDPDFLFWSPAHQRAYSVLEYGIISRAPITMLTGDVGAGKTTLVHQLLNSFNEDACIGLVSNAQGDRGELLRWVMSAFDQPTDPSAGYVDLFERFQAFLIQQYSLGRRAIIIIDEAQNLDRENLEELRMFTNINSNKDELFQLVLVGQPELRDTVMKPELSQFAQRVAAHFHLSPMTLEITQEYMSERLNKAGGSLDIFTTEACQIIFENSGGVPRIVNQLADLGLVYTFGGGEHTVTAAIMKQILTDGVFFAGAAKAEADALRLVDPVSRKS